MRLRLACSVICVGISAMALAFAQEAQGLKSGPQPGSMIPGSFAPMNVNGPKGGRPHCLVCEYVLQPVAIVFAREPAQGKDQGLNELLQKLDEAIARHQDAAFASFVVFLSPDAQSSPPKQEDANQLI